MHQILKIHNDTKIDLTDKIVYLSQATVPASTAQEIVDRFPSIPKNYLNIVDSFESGWGKDDFQI